MDLHAGSVVVVHTHAFVAGSAKQYREGAIIPFLLYKNLLEYSAYTMTCRLLYRYMHPLLITINKTLIDPFQGNAMRMCSCRSWPQQQRQYASSPFRAMACAPAAHQAWFWQWRGGACFTCGQPWGGCGRWSKASGRPGGAAIWDGWLCPQS